MRYILIQRLNLVKRHDTWGSSI